MGSVFNSKFTSDLFEFHLHIVISLGIFVILNLISYEHRISLLVKLASLLEPQNRDMDVGKQRKFEFELTIGLVHII